MGKNLTSIIQSLENDHKKICLKQKMLKRKKKTSVHKQMIKKANDQGEYKRCAHKGNEPCTKETCECFERGFCDKYCICNKNVCEFYMKGCTCKSNCTKASCPCMARGAECDEDKCKGCFVADVNHQKCVNHHYFNLDNIKKMGVGKSGIAGWGIFAMENIKSGEFICEYTGEVRVSKIKR